MKPLQHAVAFATAALAIGLTGCGGGGEGSYGSSDAPTSPAPPPPPVSQTSFTAFTRDQVTVTAMTESADPVELEKIDWTFPDGESETVYDDLLATSP